jgi:2-dehydro-3-deoxyphosphogluconate aldolase/(4S)-4-hydroxy-2-oxoglutarate aldolase
MMKNGLLRLILDKKIIAIIRGVPSKDMLSVAQALLDGGISAMEITFDQSSEAGIRETLTSLALVKGKLADKAAIGAGTVLTTEQVTEAHARGAEFIISPNVDEFVIAKTRELGMISIPGALTPSEVLAAHKMGGHIIKLFPAGLWGTEYIKAIRVPLPHIPMAAVGGVNPDNITDFFKAGLCCAGIGGNLVNAAKIREGDFESVMNNAKKFCERLVKDLEL